MSALALTFEPAIPLEPTMVGIVGSAGGINALIELLSALPPKFPFSIILAQHLARGPSNLADILRWRTGLDARWLQHGDRPLPGVVHIVRPGQAAAITTAGFMTAPLGPSRSDWLPSADHLLKSIAALHGTGAVAIVLSGMLPAGVEGLRAVRAGGGTIMAQSVRSSAYHDMPAAAADFAKADIVLGPKGLAKALVAMCRDPAELAA